MTLHNTSRAPPLTLSNHINTLEISQRSNGHQLTNFTTMLFAISPKFSNETLRLTTSPRAQFDSRLLQLSSTLTIQLSHMTTLRTRRQPARLVIKTELHGLIPIAISSPNLSHNTRTSFNNRHRH